MDRVKDQPLVPVSCGDLLDRISILAIKLERVASSQARGHVRHELGLLRGSARAILLDPGALSALDSLKKVNVALWDVEVRLREHEARQDFGAEFVELARSVYRLNDERARIKRDINRETGSEIIEEKEYSA